MARIRTIKPEFFLHEGLYDLEASTGLPIRLVFAGLWTQADREGRFVWRPRKLKTQIIPYDDVDMVRTLDALHQGGFIVRYTIDGEDYGSIPSWPEHQTVNVREPESKIPAPPLDASSTVPVQYRNIPAHDENVFARVEGKGKERKGREGERVDVSTLSADADALPPRYLSFSPSEPRTPPYDTIHAAWNSIATECGIPTARELTAARKQSIRTRWTDPSWRTSYAEAITRIRGSPFLRGENDRGWRADFDWFLKPGSVTKILEGKYDDGKKPNDDIPF